ncbi:hypothetical protein [Clostridium saccharoperbutylacetonicum]|uniref:hypothetical protein n=1 Tax=Clostridium saccharoperbutylacetonicum TaxID=36745 RepID=UPI0039ECFEBF
MKNGIKIINAEGSEILKAVAGDKNAELKYKGVFPNSMVLDKLKKNKKFKVSKADTTRDIIGVIFGYGYSVDEDTEKEIEAEDYKIDELRTKLYKDGFTLKFTNKKVVRDINDINIIKQSFDKNNIKSYIKPNKFKKKLKIKKLTYEFITYRFWMRSASKSRCGDTLYINADLYDEIYKWQTMNINLPKDKDGNVMLVEMNAYFPLTSSATEKESLILNPDNILVVDDVETLTKEMDILNVNVDKEGKCYTNKTKGKCKNTLFDGQALLDSSLFTGMYKDKGMIVGRHHFFKACIFNCNIQDYIKQWCKDNEKDYDTYKVKDRYENMINVKDVLCITSENSMKWEKFLGATKEGFDKWKKAVNENCNSFGICKTTHESKYGENQRLSYQMCNSLPIVKESVEELFEGTKSYIELLQNNTDEFVKHLKRTANTTNINNLLVDVYNQNNSFQNSYLFKNARKRLINEFKDNIRAGKLITNGDNLTVVGSPMFMLKYALDRNIEVIDDTLPLLEKGVSVYTKRFLDKEELAGFRSPFNAPNNLCYYVNHISDNMDTYFNFDNNIIAVNLIKTDIADRNNGLDTDSDFILTTNDKTTVDASKIAIKDYPTIVNNIQKQGKKYKETMEELAEIDNGLAKAKRAIGETSNLAQIAMSYYHDTKDNDLADVVAILSVLAQVAIDNSKRMYSVDIPSEMARIRSLNCMNDIETFSETYTTPKTGKVKTKEKITKTHKAKPIFWQYTNSCVSRKSIIKVLKNKLKDKITKKSTWWDLTEDEQEQRIKDYREELISKMVNIECPMNWIQAEVDKIGKAEYKKGKVPDEEFLVYYINDKKLRQTRRKATQIEKIVEDLNNKVKNIKIDDDDDDGIEELIAWKDGIEELDELKSVDIYTISLLVARTLDNSNKALKNNSKIKTKMLAMLYKYNKKPLLQCFKNTKELEEINNYNNL